VEIDGVIGEEEKITTLPQIFIFLQSCFVYLFNNVASLKTHSNNQDSCLDCLKLNDPHLLPLQKVYGETSNNTYYSLSQAGMSPCIPNAL
jgi:hypothetical protein